MDFPSTAYCRKEHVLRCGCHGNRKKITLAVIFSIIYEKRIEKSKNNQKNIHWTFGYFLLLREIQNENSYRKGGIEL